MVRNTNVALFFKPRGPNMDVVLFLQPSENKVEIINDEVEGDVSKYL